jgi:hypothetical protein
MCEGKHYLKCKCEHLDLCMHYYYYYYFSNLNFLGNSLIIVNNNAVEFWSVFSFKYSTGIFWQS